MFSCFSNLLGANNYHEKPKTDPKINCILRSEVLGIGTLMPHLLGFLVWDGGHRLPKGPIPYVLAREGGRRRRRREEEEGGGRDIGNRFLREPMPKSKLGRGRFGALGSGIIS
jgi:hypothetical protein